MRNNKLRQASAADRTLPLFEPTLEDALATERRFPLGSRFHKGWTQCSRKQRPGCACHSGPNKHGPYWYALEYGQQGGRRYVGSDARRREIELAWKVVIAARARGAVVLATVLASPSRRTITPSAA